MSDIFGVDAGGVFFRQRGWTCGDKLIDVQTTSSRKQQTTAPDQNRIVYVTAGPAIPAACKFTLEDAYLFVKLMGLHSVALIEKTAFIRELDFVETSDERFSYAAMAKRSLRV
jgi:hypothetical protein